MNYFTEHRQQWIADMMRVYGFINRVHLQRKFGISVPQASKDLVVFHQAHIHHVHYDLSKKCYVWRDR